MGADTFLLCPGAAGTTPGRVFGFGICSGWPARRIIWIGPHPPSSERIAGNTF